MQAPKITQPWMVRYETWLADNDEHVASLGASFLEQLATTSVAPGVDRAAALERMLRLAYWNSSSARRAAVRAKNAAAMEEEHHGLGAFGPLPTRFVSNARFLDDRSD